MANTNNANVVSSIDGFERMMWSMIQQLSLISQEYSDFMGEASRSSVQAVITTLNSIRVRESARRPRSDTYSNVLVDNAADIPGRRNQHNDDLARFVNVMVDTITNKATPLDQQLHIDQCHSILPVEPPVAYEPDAMFPGRVDHGQVQSNDHGSPLRAAGDQASSDATRGARSSGPFYCKFEACQVPNAKPYKFLSKLRDHERSHEPAAFACSECSQKFKQARILKKHLLRVHKINQSQHGVRDFGSQIFNATFTEFPLTPEIQVHQSQMVAEGAYQEAYINQAYMAIDPSLIRCPTLNSPEDMGMNDLDHMFLVHGDTAMSDSQSHFGGSEPDYM